MAIVSIASIGSHGAFAVSDSYYSGELDESGEPSDADTAYSGCDGPTRVGYHVVNEAHEYILLPASGNRWTRMEMLSDGGPHIRDLDPKTAMEEEGDFWNFWNTFEFKPADADAMHARAEQIRENPPKRDWTYWIPGFGKNCSWFVEEVLAARKCIQ